MIVIAAEFTGNMSEEDQLKQALELSLRESIHDPQDANDAQNLQESSEKETFTHADVMDMVDFDEQWSEEDYSQYVDISEGTPKKEKHSRRDSFGVKNCDGSADVNSSGVSSPEMKRARVSQDHMRLRSSSSENRTKITNSIRKATPRSLFSDRDDVTGSERCKQTKPDVVHVSSSPEEGLHQVTSIKTKSSGFNFAFQDCISSVEGASGGVIAMSSDEDDDLPKVNLTQASTPLPKPRLVTQQKRRPSNTASDDVSTSTSSKYFRKSAASSAANVKSRGGATNRELNQQSRRTSASSPPPPSEDGPPQSVPSCTPTKPATLPPKTGRSPLSLK